MNQPTTIALQASTDPHARKAAKLHFGTITNLDIHSTINGVFRAVEQNTATYGVVPLESSREGILPRTFECFSTRDVKICGEVTVVIQYTLLIKQHNDLETVEIVYCDNLGFEDYESWLRNHLPNARIQLVTNSADAVSFMQSHSNAAAVTENVDRIQATSLTKQVINDPRAKNKYMRYVIIGQELAEPTRADKTTIIVKTKDEPGSLYRILSPFDEHAISLSRIETRQVEGGDECQFLIEFDGHVKDVEIEIALASIRQMSTQLIQLGSYPDAN